MTARYGNDGRTLRDRQAALRADADAARSARPERVARRRLLQVVDGGHMPTAADHWFLGNPVDLGGPESEGGAPQSAAMSGTIPFVVLGRVPQVGDQLVATAVGGRWVAEIGGGSTTICIAACSPSVPIAGALITVLTGSAVVATCTTDSTGCCKVPVGTGNFRVQVSYNGTILFSAVLPLVAGGTRTIGIPTPRGGVVACCDCTQWSTNYPTLYATGIGGKIPMTLQSFGFWAAHVVIDVDGVVMTKKPVDPGLPSCNPCPAAATGAMTVALELICQPDPSGHGMDLTFSYAWTGTSCAGSGCISGGFSYVLDASEECDHCGSGTTIADPFTDLSALTLILTNCQALTLDTGIIFTLPTMGNFTPLPGGNIVKLTSS